MRALAFVRWVLGIINSCECPRLKHTADILYMPISPVGVLVQFCSKAHAVGFRQMRLGFASISCKKLLKFMNLTLLTYFKYATLFVH